jgi:hypothetical protein
MMPAETPPRGRLFEFLDKSNEHTKNLANKGYTIAKICSAERASELEKGTWTDLEGLGTGIDRYDPNTWKNNVWPQTTHGLLQNQGAGLWRGTCKARLETVSFWRTLFGGERPLLSFDAISVARPDSQARVFKREKDEHGLSSWLHTDQAKGKPQCMHHLQGALALTKLGEAEQRTQLVIPKAEETIQSFRDRFVAAFPPEPAIPGKPDAERSEWIKHTDAEKDWLAQNGRVVCPTLEPGEMLIWDSGVPHASIAGALPVGQLDRRTRISVFVSAVPKSIVPPEDIKVRQYMLEKGFTSGHRVTEKGKKGKYLACKFEKKGRTYGNKLPDYSDARAVSGFKRAYEAEIAGDDYDKIAAKMAKYCAGY